MNAHTGRPPAFEFNVAARAGEVLFSVVGEPRVCTEGTARVERAGDRGALPRPVRPGLTYHDVRVSFHIAAWLRSDQPGESGDSAG